MVKRNNYLGKLKTFINKEQIKILTGIRRSGKSSVLQLLRETLIERNVQSKQIIYINLESFKYSDIVNAQSLYDYVQHQISRTLKTYLLIDEVQEIEGWEKAIKSFLVDYDVDIYLTGSNAYLLSSELSTYLAGRYIEIPIFTLSFSEFLDFRSTYFPGENQKLRQAFNTYLHMGGFPVLHTTNYTMESAYNVVYDIYSSVLLRDTVQRHQIRNVELLERVVKYAFDNIGNTFSGKNLADYFKSQQRKVDLNTVYNYLHALESAFILYRIPRYDIHGKEILKTQEKYYLGDIGLLFATMGFRNRKIGGILENIVFLELKRRGYQVFIGKLGQKEIDFIAEKPGQRMYVQVAYKLENEQTVEREFENLLAVKDQYPKYVVSMDELWKETVEGVPHYHISDFLLMDQY